LALGTDINLAAVRLDALTHPSLPGNGPGRYPGRIAVGAYRGTFCQHYWNVIATSPNRKDPITLEFDNASTDAGFAEPITSKGFWNIWDGGEGRNCTAIWSLSTPVSLVAGTALIFEMQFGGVGEENLGRFRLSVSSDPTAFQREQKRFAAMQLTDPWAKLAAAYNLLRDRQALDRLPKRHPAAAVGIGDMYAAFQEWERAIAEYSKVITDQPADVAVLIKLATAYAGAGRTREAVPLLAKASAANPNETIRSLELAALQAWFGQEKELAATRQRILTFAKGTNEWMLAACAAKVCSILPPSDKAEREAALALGRTAVKVGKDSVLRDWSLLSLGMAEYRSGNDAAADQTLRAAAEAGPNNPRVTGTSAFYRAMSLFRQGKPDEARKLVTAAAAKMKPLPKDENNPLAGDASHDDVILWLAYKEARAMIRFDESPPSKPEQDNK
jgi:tetratricopeptide (TPR) repeat protein